MSLPKGRAVRAVTSLLEAPERTVAIRFLWVLLGWNVALFLVAALDGSLFLPGADRGLLQDVAQLGNCAGQIMAVVTGLRLLRRLHALPDVVSRTVRAAHYPASEADRLATLAASDVRDALGALLLATRKSRRWAVVVAGTMSLLVLVFSVLIPLFAHLPVRSWNLWPTRYPLGWIVGTAWNVFTFVVVAGTALWVLVCTAFVAFPAIKRQLSNERLKVVPLSPDGRGGLAFIGDLSLSMTYVLGSGIPLLITFTLFSGANVATATAAPLYLGAIAVLFFAPLLTVHGAMRRAKYREQERIATRFLRLYAELEHADEGAAQGQADGGAVPSRLDHLVQLDALYRRAERMPVWPFDLETLRRFMSLIVLPLLVWLLQWFTNNALSRAFGVVAK